jgi:hypothetical protein
MGSSKVGFFCFRRRGRAARPAGSTFSLQHGGRVASGWRLDLRGEKLGAAF